MATSFFSKKWKYFGYIYVIVPRILYVMRSEEEISDIELARLCSKGSKEGQRMLYDKYAAYLYTLCCRYVSDKSMAQDLMHDSMIKIFGAIRQWRPTGTLKGWMARVTLNLVLDHLRREKSIIMEDFSTIETPTEEVDIEQVKSLSFDEILSLMERLSPMKRVVFNLYYVENCTHREIASMLGIKEKTSSSILFKARTDLMNIIKYNK